MNKLPKRTLSPTLNVSTMGYGAMGLSEFYGAADDKVSLALLHTVVESGITLIDTADMYGRGHNEDLIGKLWKQLSPSTKAQLVIATKCGIDRSHSLGYGRSINNSPDYIRQSCEASLSRLGVEQIGLYYIHRIDMNHPIEETMQTLAELVQEGKIAHVGLCEVSAKLLMRAHRTFPVDVVQSEYSLWTRDIEDNGVLALLKENSIGLVPYSPLGRGFLTGKYQSEQDLAADDFRRENPRFSTQNIELNRSLLQAIAPMANKYDCTSGQIALAWLLSQYDHLVPIPGTKREKYLLENINACFVHLDADDINTLNQLKNHITIYGERYTEEGMKGITK